MLSLTLILGAKNREKENNLKKRIENRRKMRKDLSSLLATLTLSYQVVRKSIQRRVEY